MSKWISLGKVDDLINEIKNNNSLFEIELESKKILLTYHNQEFGAIASHCNHMGAPLKQGRLKDDGCVECPWHYWQFDHKTGEAKNKSYDMNLNMDYVKNSDYLHEQTFDLLKRAKNLSVALHKMES